MHKYYPLVTIKAIPKGYLLIGNDLLESANG